MTALSGRPLGRAAGAQCGGKLASLGDGLLATGLQALVGVLTALGIAPHA